MTRHPFASATQARLLWAKSDDDRRWHPLWCHLIDVGMVAHERYPRLAASLRNEVARWLGCSDDQARRIVAFVTAAHDLGKCSPGFQAKFEPSRLRLAEAGVGGWSRDALADHGEASVAVIRQLLIDRLNLGPAVATQLAQCSAIHHGRYGTAGADVRRFCQDVWVRTPVWRQMAEALFDLLAGVFEFDASSLPASASTSLSNSLTIWLAGFVSVSDWVGSDVSAFPFADASDDPAVYAARSRRQAAEVVSRIGLDEALPYLPAAFRDRFGFEPRRLQERARAMVANVTSPCLLIAETQMGEGKTEAALDVAAELSLACGHKGLFVGLPTQATANAMHLRVERFVRLATGDRVPVRLAHGLSWLGASLEPRSVWDEQRDTPAVSWFAGAKRALLQANGVGTVDQALSGVLGGKHAFVRLGALAGKVVVLDEVHAYDTYTGEHLECLVEWLAAEGASVVLLSATLPSNRRFALLQRWRRGRGGRASNAELAAVAYPRLTLLSDETAQAEHVEATPDRRVEVAITHVDDDLAANVANLVDTLRDGGCAAWICNTVKRAQAVVEALRACGDADLDVMLLHARFTARDRRELEERAAAKFGPGGDRPYRAVLVGTQVLEQSLDFDFDVIVSDMAPVDLVLQRLGRLHRHRREWRPVRLVRPQAWIVGATEVGRFEPATIGGVYSEVIMWRSRAALDVHSVTLPDAIEDLVEAVYVARELASVLDPEVIEVAQKRHDEESRTDQNKARRYHLQAVGTARAWQDVMSIGVDDHDDGDPTATRLGEPSQRVVVAHRVGQKLCLTETGEESFDESMTPDASLIARLFDASLSLSCRSLRGIDPSVLKQPDAWARNGMTRNLRLVVFESGVAADGSNRLEYDNKRGWTRASTEGNP